MSEAWDFLMRHPLLMPIAGWIFSAAVSSMPPLADHAPYAAQWAHDFLQLLAANLNRKTILSTSISTPHGTMEQVQTEGPATAVPSNPTPEHKQETA